MRLCVCAAALSAAMIVGVGTAQADLYRYVGQITASGTVGSETFTNVPVTITLIGDTNNYESNNGFIFLLRDVNNAATVDIGGLGVVTVTSPSFVVFSNTGFGTAGFGRAGGNPLIRTANNSVITNLAEEIPPTAFTPNFIPNSANVATNLGTLTFSSSTGNFVFSSTLVPSPGAAALLGVGGLVAMRRRRR